MRGKTKDWLKKKIFSKFLKLSGRFSKFTKNDRVLENVDSQNVQIQKILRDHMGFFLLASSSSSLLRLLLECVAAEIFLAIFDAIFFHIWGVLEPRKESESSASLLVREILIFWHFILFYFILRWLIIFQIRGVLDAHKRRSRNRQQQRPCSCSSIFYFLWQLFVVISPKSEEFWGKTLVRSHNH